MSKIFGLIDQILDQITMYRLVLYFLIFFVLVAAFLGIFDLIPFGPLEILLSTSFLVFICWSSNKLVSKVLRAPANTESSLITALILSLIITPPHDLEGYVLFLGVGALAMLVKYVLAINKKHIFNPAAIAVVLSSIVFGQSASWWVGTAPLAPFVIVCGLLIVRKLQFERLIFSFLVTAIVMFTLFLIINGQVLTQGLVQLLLNSPLFFFAFVMLTEPSTLPPSKNLRTIYGALIGVLSVIPLSVGSFYLTPEISLAIGNVFSFLVGARRNLLLSLGEKRKIAENMLEFSFLPNSKFTYSAGQYMEWTLPHKNADARGNRRYFTLSSSPSEKNIAISVRFNDKGSSYKKALANLDKEILVKAGSLGGDFTLPKNKSQKIVFVAGGIGITPYRSMIKYLLDKQEKRDIVVLYSNTNENEIAYKDIFDQAIKNLGIRVVYVLTGENISTDWDGERGRINKEMIISAIPDYKERLFYISGSLPLVNGIKKSLKELGAGGSKVKTDFFPGYV